MLATTKVKMSSSKKKSEQHPIQYFLHIPCNEEVSGSFTLSSWKSTAKKCTKQCAVRAKLFFCYLDLLFFGCFSCCRRLTLHECIILFQYTIDIRELMNYLFSGKWLEQRPFQQEKGNLKIQSVSRSTTTLNLNINVKLFVHNKFFSQWHLLK